MRRGQKRKDGSHDDGDEDGGAHPLEEDVGEGFEDGVGHEEDGQGRVVRPRAQLQILGKTSDLGVADVGTVEESQQIQQTQLDRT
jgi:hypothetical protein